MNLSKITELKKNTEPKKDTDIMMNTLLKKNTVEMRLQFIGSKKFQITGLIFALFCMSLSLYQSKKSHLQALEVGQKSPNGVCESEIIVTPNVWPNQTETNDKQELTLNALSACLMDASNGRVLYEKDAYKEMPMASTTKIMTLLVALENANLEDIVTVSTNAAKQPDVQLNINTGEQYVLRDLLYSLMLESHNDTAVAIAEHIGGSVEEFCDMMTVKAKEIGADHTQFKTPNGLDADGHYTTARDLSLIASYAIQNDEFCKIVKTQTYQFDSVDKKRSFNVNNKDRFLYMMEGSIGIKTGYTGKAGYCFVGAIRLNGKTLVSTVLGSGWPPHKEYKWADTRRLMNYGLDNYELTYLFNHLNQDMMVSIPNQIKVYEGKQSEIAIRPYEDLRNEKILMSKEELVSMQLTMNPYVVAPLENGSKVGMITYYIGDEVYREVPIVTKEEAQEVDFFFLFKQVIDIW